MVIYHLARLRLMAVKGLKQQRQKQLISLMFTYKIYIKMHLDSMQGITGLQMYIGSLLKYFIILHIEIVHSIWLLCCGMTSLSKVRIVLKC